MITALIRNLLNSSDLTPAFIDTLDQLGQISLSSSLAIREPLARLVVSHPALLQHNFSRHSVSERATAETLRGIVATLRPTPLRDDLLRHARDEFRHARIFAALSRTLTPVTGNIVTENYDWILENDRHFVEHYNGDVIEFVCELFSGEVRTYFFLSGYIEALEQDNSAHAAKTARVLRRVLEDECRHIGYTARYINHWMAEALDLGPSLQRSFKAFDRNSWVDVAVTARFFYERN